MYVLIERKKERKRKKVYLELSTPLTPLFNSPWKKKRLTNYLF